MIRTWSAVALVVVAEAFAQERNSSPACKGSAQRILVSIPDRKLALIENGRVVRTYPVAVGAPSSPSPVGAFTIAQRVPNPTWYGPNGTVVGPGKANPVGTRWLGLSRKGYGIHGTNVPSSIGHNASHGCIRMRNRDVEELFELVSVGATVELHGERTPELELIFGTPQSPAAGFAVVAMAAGY
jgi:lipoprotein-anchoring transpeptidase ErfK/SrfK